MPPFDESAALFRVRDSDTRLAGSSIPWALLSGSLRGVFRMPREASRFAVQTARGPHRDVAAQG